MDVSVNGMNCQSSMPKMEDSNSHFVSQVCQVEDAATKHKEVVESPMTKADSRRQASKANQVDIQPRHGSERHSSLPKMEIQEVNGMR